MVRAKRVKRALKTLASGIVYGLTLYFVYGFLFPILLSQAGLPVSDVRRWGTGFFFGFLVFFVSIESVASAMKGTVYGFVFRAISKLMGLLLFISVMKGGVIEAWVPMGGVEYHVVLDLSPLVSAVVLFTLPFIMLDVMGVFRESGG